MINIARGYATTMMCGTTDVGRVVDITGRWTDAQINAEIQNQTINIYEECGDPLACADMLLCKDPTATDDFYRYFYLGEPRILCLDRIFVGTTTKREVRGTSSYTLGKKVGMIYFSTTYLATTRMDASDNLYVHYVPGYYQRYCAIRTAEALLEKVDVVTRGETSKELEMVRNKRAEQERVINNKICSIFSSKQIWYNSEYGINRKTVDQDFDANKYRWHID